MSTFPDSTAPTLQVAPTVIPLSAQAYAIKFDASLPSVLPTDQEPKYLGQFSAEQELAILNMVRQTLKKPTTTE
tara:strand:- start:918 stop:1139 length:222 start_codon:yes stop_codon:yes gene_type:complete